MAGLYVKLDTDFPDDEKVIAVGLEGAGLYAMALCIAKRKMSDGRVHRVLLRRLGATDDLIDSCIAESLFVADGDAVRVAAWLKHNEAAEVVAEEMARRGRLGNHRRWGHRGPPDECDVCAGESQSRTVRPIGSQTASRNGRRTSLETETETETERGATEGATRKRATPPPERFEVTEDLAAWAKAKGVRADLTEETDRFLDYHRAKGNTLRDWRAAWRNWMSRADAYAPPGTVGAPIER